MKIPANLQALVKPFLDGYDQLKATNAWAAHMHQFRAFWNDRIMAPGQDVISDDDCDQIIRILDRNGKGNKEGCEAVAKVMVPQGAWRLLLNELHSNKELGKSVDAVLNSADGPDRAQAIDHLYKTNKNRNRLTGDSGNVIGAMLAVWEPGNNLAMISIAHRRKLLDYLQVTLDFDWDSATRGERYVGCQRLIMQAGKALGLGGNARTINEFFYFGAVYDLWAPTLTVAVPNGSIAVTVPAQDDDDSTPSSADQADGVRESMQIQALIAKIGAAMGYSIWLPRNDRSRVQLAWTPAPGQLVDKLPFAFDNTTTATIEQIDVIWIRGRAIVRAFEVEGTTAIYSGLLRMADLVALQPNLAIKMHIVADNHRREKVMSEITRPVFSLLDGGALRDKCTYLSYDSIKAIGALPHLDHLKESFLSQYEEQATSGDDD